MRRRERKNTYLIHLRPVAFKAKSMKAAVRKLKDVCYSPLRKELNLSCYQVSEFVKNHVAQVEEVKQTFI